MAKVTPNIDPGSATLTPTVNDIYGLVETIARQIFRSVDSANPLAEVFDKGTIDKGTTVQQVMIQLTESYAFNKNAVDQLVAKDPTLLVRYFNDWTERQFEQTVREDEIRKVLIGSSSVDELAGRIVGNLSESYDNEMFIDEKAVIASAITAMTSAGAPADVDELLTSIRNVADSFSFVNNTYSIAGAVHSTRMEDIVVLIPYNIKNVIDVTKLANTWNLSKNEILPRIITIDTTDNNVIIADKNFFFKYNRLLEVEPARNVKARATNYYLTADDLLGYAPFFKATYLDASALV